MNAAQVRHSGVHNAVAYYLTAKRPDLFVVVEFDHQIIRKGRSIEYIIDIAGIDRKTKTVAIAIEIAATTQKKDGSGGRKFSDYELSQIPHYLVVDCKAESCILYEHNAEIYEPVDISQHYPELPEIVRATIAHAKEFE